MGFDLSWRMKPVTHTGTDLNPTGVGQGTSHPGCTLNLAAGKLYSFTAASHCRGGTFQCREVSRASHKLKKPKPCRVLTAPLGCSGKSTVPQQKPGCPKESLLHMHWAKVIPHSASHQHRLRKRRAKIFHAYQRHEHMQSSRRSAQYFSYAVPFGKGSHMHVDLLYGS